MKHYTTIEQSKKLVELGLNPDTADMKWYYWKDEIDAPKVPTLGFDKAVLESYKNTQAVYLPCWSLGALLEVLKTRKDCTFITIHSGYSLKWILNTSYYELANWKEKETIEETLIDTVYNTIVWLLENGYIKKGE